MYFFSDNLFGCIACQMLEGLVEPGDPEIRIPYDNRSIGVIKEFFQVVTGLSVLLFCLSGPSSSFIDVPPKTQHLARDKNSE